MLKLYESMIKPIMCYGSEIWGFKEDKELERIELWFLRSILHLPNSAVGMAVRGELGQLPLYLWWKERILNYWNRLRVGDIPPILRDAACLSLLNAKCGKQSWVKNVMNIFDWAGYSSCFSEISGCDHELRNLLMCSFRDQFLQTWTNSLQRHHSMKGPGGNKLRTYRLFKHVFELEPYLPNVQTTAYGWLSQDYELALIHWQLR